MEDRLFSRRYRVVERIGSGGMAEVFKAKDEVLGRTVALKVLHRQFADDASFVARFRQEAQAAANLSHPNIVNIYDWGRDEDDYYIVMEFIRGIDLKTLVERRGAVDPFESAEYGVQVAAALNAAHGYGVVHRDIKPHNIVLTGEGTVKVTDFGIARAGDTSMTQTGSVLGTAQYISPEQAQGRPLGPQADIYSLGVVLYELTTGRVPFEGDQPITIALKQVNEEPAPPRDIDPSIPEAMEAVILRAMRKDPADRYASADEMRRDLKRVAAGQPVEAPEPRVDRTTVMPAAPVERPDRYQEPRRPSRRRRPWGWIAAAVVLLALLAVGVAYTLGAFGEEEVTVPTVVGLTSEEATATLQAADLAPGEVTLEYSDSVAAGVVMGQDPAAGADVPIGSTVDVVISRGIETATVPGLVDMPEADAIRALRDAGFELETIQREYSTEVEEGLVIRHIPEAGTSVAAGSQITLVVSNGEQLVEVPDVSEMAGEEARQALEAVGLTAVVDERFSDEVEEGDVISQSPGPGVSIAAGSSVTVVVSKGPDIVTVPDVTGEDEEDAVALIRDAGLVPEVEYVDSSQDGVVISQWPIADASAKRDSTVTLTVGRTPADEGDGAGG